MGLLFIRISLLFHTICCHSFFFYFGGGQNSETVMILKKKKNTVPFLLCLILYLRAISKYNLPDLYSEGRFNKGAFCVICLQGLIFWILWYLRNRLINMECPYSSHWSRSEHFFCILSVLTRLVGIIGTKAKEYILFWPPFMQSVYVLYKIIKIVGTHLLVNRCVYMRACKHGCEITGIFIEYVLSDARFDWLVGNMTLRRLLHRNGTLP